MTNSTLSKNKSSLFHTEVTRIESATTSSFSDVLAVEEPLEIRLDYRDPKNGVGPRKQKSVSITMRTPGHDFDLAVGFLFTEGLLTKVQDVLDVQYCGPALAHLGHSNVVKIELADDVDLDLQSLERHFYTSSSCGVCGKASIDALKTQNQFSQDMTEDAFRFAKKLVVGLPDKLRAAQNVFEATGGLHASGLFSADGELLAIREDVGRHNALDKLIGQAFLKKELPLSRTILLLSGRISFELVQKASMAGIRSIVAVGAPSSLALELAREMNMTLIGFVRAGRFNVYHGEGRLI